MTIEYSEQLEKFSFDSAISPQYIPYIVYGPDSLGDSVSEAEVQKIDQFLEKYEFVSFDENRLESPDFGRCSISGMQVLSTKRLSKRKSKDAQLKKKFPA